MELGKKISFNKKYERIEVGFSPDDETQWERKWIEKDVEETNGIFIGYRNLIKTVFIYDKNINISDAIDFRNLKQEKSALVAINKQQCLKVPINCLKEID